MNSIILEDILSFYYYWFNRTGFFLHFFSCLSINTYGFSQYWQDVFSFDFVDFALVAFSFCSDSLFKLKSKGLKVRFLYGEVDELKNNKFLKNINGIVKRLEKDSEKWML